MPLSRWLFFLSLAGLLVAFAGVYALVWYLRGTAVRSFAVDDARQRSVMIFEALYAGMRAGWGKDDIAATLERLNRVLPGMQVRILRGGPVIRQFGEIPGERALRESDPVLAAALRDGRETLRREGDMVRYVYPVRVRDECLRCHTQARPGDVNGVIDIRLPLGEVRAPVRTVWVVVAVGVSALLLVLFAFLQLDLHLGVLRPIRRLLGVIDRVERDRDLARRVSEAGRIRELVQLACHFNRLLESLQRHTRELENYAVRDTLTGLYNRRKFEEFLVFEVQRARRSGTMFCLVMLDLDNFKHINDTFGHPVGDMVLREVSQVIRMSIRTTDLAARLGGDEFAVVLPETSPEAGVRVAAKVREGLEAASIPLPGGGTRITASIGLVSYPRNGANSAELHSAMDLAMYKAKREGKNRVVVLGREDQERMTRVFLQADALRRALDEDRIEVALQPIVDLRSGGVFGYEALARLREGDRLLSASRFIEVAEQAGLAGAVDLRVVERVCAVHGRGPLRGATVFVNLSSRTFADTGSLRRVAKVALEAGVDAAGIVFEITEREAIPQIARLRTEVERLRGEGFRFALDDFGSGFSSFLYLKYLPVDFVKIEGSFVRHMVGDERDRAMVEHMHQLAHRFGLRTIAEFVEDAATHSALGEIGVDFAQGYYYGEPRLFEELE